MPRLEKVPGVLAVTPVLYFSALLQSAQHSAPVQVRGVDPSTFAKASGLPGAIVQGTMPAGPGQVALGEQLAKTLGLELGGRVVISAASPTGPTATGAKVVGLIKTGLSAVDKQTALVTIDQARTLTGVSTATGVILGTAPGREAGLARKVAKLLPAGLGAYSVETLMGPVWREIRGEVLVSIPILLLFSLFAALAVVSTALVAVLERTREFGLLLALGLTPGRLAWMVVLEILLVTTAGWLLGLIFGYAITIALGHWNLLGWLMVRPFESVFGIMGVAGQLLTPSKPIYALYASATLAFALILALLLPVRYVLRLRPAKALTAE